jgi:hypothetical protein
VSADAGPTLGAWEPPAGVLREYENYWSPTTDAPRVYHVCAGLLVLAATVANRVFLRFGGEAIYPNVWALILGPSSFFRKSTVISKARRTLARLHAESNGHGPLLPDEFSREALLKKLSDCGQGMLTYSEFSGALANFGRDYMAGTKELLADLYDSPEVYTRVVGANNWTLHNVCISILAASQTDWFLEKLKAGDVRGGFLARFSFWPAFEKRRFLALPPDPDHAVGARLLRGLNEVRQVKGVVELAATERATYSAWLEHHERELHGVAKPGELSPFWTRLSIMTLKFAVLLQLSHDRELVIRADTLDCAIELTEFLKRALRHLFNEEFAFSKGMQDRQRVLRAVQRKPGISYRDLLRSCSLLKREFEPVLETLQAEELIHIDRKSRQVWALEMSAASVVVSDPPTDALQGRIVRVK